MKQIELRGVSQWLVKEYLAELGGREDGATAITGPGWTAQMAVGEPFQVGSLRVGRLFVTFDGRPDTVEQVAGRLERKAIRAGG